jgi:hypothetical protein
LPDGHADHEVETVAAHDAAREHDPVALRDLRSDPATVTALRHLRRRGDRHQVRGAACVVRGHKVATDHEDGRSHRHQQDHHSGGKDRPRAAFVVPAARS